MEKIRKVDEYSVEVVEAEKIVPEVVLAIKTLNEMEEDLKQAQDSLVYVQQRHAEEVAPIQKTIEIMQARLDEATAKGVVAKPVEVEEPIPPIEEMIIK